MLLAGVRALRVRLDRARYSSSRRFVRSLLAHCAPGVPGVFIAQRQIALEIAVRPIGS